MAAEAHMPEKLTIPRDAFEDVMKRRFFYAPSFDIHGGCRGLYDYGPPGCAFMSNLISLWRQHFILEDSLLEIDSSCMTPSVVFETSGHVARFKDMMVKDIGDGSCHRADHLLEDKMDELLAQPNLTEEQIQEYKQVRGRADDYSEEELADALVKYNV